MKSMFLSGTALLFVAAVLPMQVLAQGDVPREETLILASDVIGNVAATYNFNPYLSAVQRSLGMAQSMEETLFYTNYETKEIVPWLAIGDSVNSDFTRYAINLGEGFAWSEGQVFTADDVVFTIDMLLEDPIRLRP